MFDGETVVLDRKPNLFSYETMKRAVELYEGEDIFTGYRPVSDYTTKELIWSWCVNTALAEHNNAID